jgi:hypothetical protein
MMEERRNQKKGHIRLRFRGRPTSSRRRRRQFGLTKPGGGGNETPYTLSHTRWICSRALPIFRICHDSNGQNLGDMFYGL